MQSNLSFNRKIKYALDFNSLGSQKKKKKWFHVISHLKFAKSFQYSKFSLLFLWVSTDKQVTARVCESILVWIFMKPASLPTTMQQNSFIERITKVKNFCKLKIEYRNRYCFEWVRSCSRVWERWDVKSQSSLLHIFSACWCKRWGYDLWREEKRWLLICVSYWEGERKRYIMVFI